MLGALRKRGRQENLSFLPASNKKKPSFVGLMWIATLSGLLAIDTLPIDLAQGRLVALRSMKIGNY